MVIVDWIYTQSIANDKQIGRQDKTRSAKKKIFTVGGGMFQAKRPVLDAREREKIK